MSAVLNAAAAPSSRAGSFSRSQLSLHGLRKAFSGTPAIHQLDLQTREGEFISLLGPSGCGKTTTLRCVAGFEYPDAGEILVDGKDISGLPPERRDIGMVFQNYALFPHLTVWRNLAFGLEMRGIPAADIRRRVERVLAMVQLERMAERYPRQLSGGQQQRVALARALVIEPRLLLLDEPLANLDAVLREDMRVFIRELQQRVGITTLYVTHDQSEAMVMSDRVAVMLGGRLQQFDVPEAIYLRPRTLDVARFIGRSNLFAARVLAPAVGLNGVAERRGYRLASAMGELDAVCDESLAPGRAVHVAVRPEAILFDDQGELGGVVEQAYFLGSTVEHTVRCAQGAALLVQAPPARRAAVGDSVRLRIDARQAWIIADDGKGAPVNAPPAATPLALSTGVPVAEKGPGQRSDRAAAARRRAWWLIAPALVMLGVFLVLPYLNIVLMSLRPPAVGAPYGDGYTLANYLRTVSDGYMLGVLADTLLLGLIVTPVCLLLGYPVAYHLARTRSRWGGVLYLLVLSPLLVGVVVRSFGWLILLSGNGVVNRVLIDAGLIEAGLQLMNNRLGVAIALVHVFLPFMILPLVAALQSIDPTLEAAARSLGASRLRAFWRVTLPMSLPGIQAGTILVFVLTLSAYVTPVMLGGAQVKTLSVLVVQNLIDNFQWPMGAAQALVLTMCGAAAVMIYGRLTGRLMKGWT